VQARAVELGVLPGLRASELTPTPGFLRASERPFSQAAMLVFEGATAGPQLQRPTRSLLQPPSAELDVWIVVVYLCYCVRS